MADEGSNYEGRLIAGHVLWVRDAENGGKWIPIVGLKGVPGEKGGVYIPQWDGRYLTFKYNSTSDGNPSPIALDLKGPQGERGPEGPQGKQGSRGPQGERGPEGKDGEGAFELAAQAGYEGTARAFYDALAAVVATGEKAQEAIELAKKNNHAHLFETQEEHDLWLADPQMTNTLNIGDLLFVKETAALSIWDGDNEIGFPTTATLDLHIKNKDNPHEVRAEQVPYEKVYKKKTYAHGDGSSIEAVGFHLYDETLVGISLSKITLIYMGQEPFSDSKDDPTVLVVKNGDESRTAEVVFNDRGFNQGDLIFTFDPPLVITDNMLKGFFHLKSKQSGKDFAYRYLPVVVFPTSEVGVSNSGVAVPKTISPAGIIEYKINYASLPYILLEFESGHKSVKDALDELYDCVGDETYTKEETDAKIAEHANRTDNPHQVTAAQVGALTETAANGLYPRFRDETSNTTVGNNYGRNVMASQNEEEGGFYVTGVAGNPPIRKQWLTEYQRNRVRVYTATSGESKDYYWDDSSSGDAEKAILRWCDLFAQAVTTVWRGIMRMCNPRIAANADDASKDIALVPNANGQGLQVQFPGGATAMILAKTGTLATVAEVNEKDASTLAEAKTYADGKVAGAYRYKGTVASKEALPTSGNTVGDVWNVSEDGMNYAWTGEEWDALGTSVDLSAYYTKTESDGRYLKLDGGTLQKGATITIPYSGNEKIDSLRARLIRGVRGDDATINGALFLNYQSTTVPTEDYLKDVGENTEKYAVFVAGWGEEALVLRKIDCDTLYAAKADVYTKTEADYKYLPKNYNISFSLKEANGVKTIMLRRWGEQLNIGVATDGSATIDFAGSSKSASIEFYSKAQVDEKIEAIELTPGPQGPQGETGPQGPKGDPGDPATVPIDTTMPDVPADDHVPSTKLVKDYLLNGKGNINYIYAGGGGFSFKAGESSSIPGSQFDIVPPNPTGADKFFRMGDSSSAAGLVPVPTKEYVDGLVGDISAALAQI